LKPAAIIFDMDDTLVCSAPIWRAAEIHVLRMMGGSWSSTLAAKYKGMNALDVARVMHTELRCAVPLEACQQALRERLIDGFRQGCRAMPGAADLLTRLGGGTRLAVASGSPLAAIQMALADLQWSERFELLVTSEDVPRGKPAPDVFLRAATLLNVSPAQCLVVEDSPVGCRAARAAGMRCFAVPSVSPEEVRDVATRIFPSLAHIQLHDLEG